jgi:hypothetical protein
MYNVTLSSVRVATVVVQMTADYVYPKCTVVGGGMKIRVFWNPEPCRLVHKFQAFGGAF